MYLNFQAKGLLPNRTLESFIQRSTDGVIPNLKVNPYRVYFEELFLNSLGRIFQVKGQSKRVISLFFCFVFFVYKTF